MAFDVKVQKAAAEPEELVVILHGLKRVILQHVPRVISNHLPNADILQPTYDAGWPSNLDPIQLAAELSELIQAQCDAHASTAGSPYKRIILIGHSRGALLIRKAYVFACGQNQELWRGGLRPQSQPWARAVTRIILMAGMNRGWSLSPKPPRMSCPDVSRSGARNAQPSRSEWVAL